jgi:D-glycero-D-manno-heptose 1,7-bisphosphate phosphatase
MKQVDAVILAGGKGSRIKSYIGNNPKPLIKLGDRSFLEYLINNICKYNIRKIYILAGYKGIKIYKKFNNKIINFVKIKCIIEKKPLGTGGCLHLIKNKISNKFLVFNGDSIFDININNFTKVKMNKNNIILAVTKNTNYSSNAKLSNLHITKEKRVEFKNNSKIMNGGVYFFNKTIFKNIKNKNISLEDDIIEKAIRNHQVKGFYSDNFFLDIGTKKNLLLAKKKIPSYFYRPAIFLDRDGTINEDKGYVHKINDFILKKKIKKVLEFFSQNNFYLFIVTNQAGIGHGFYKIKDFIKLHEFIKYNFIKKNIYINEVKFCPYHPKAKIKRFRRRSSFRKPNNSMINEILRDWDVNIKRSLMIGDKKIDQQCAQRSKLKFIYYSKNIFSEVRKKIKIH